MSTVTILVVKISRMLRRSNVNFYFELCHSPISVIKLLTQQLCLIPKFSCVQEEVIVNTTGDNIDLSKSTGRVLAELAGPELKQACVNLRPLQPGCIKETTGFGIKTCKKILRCNCYWAKNDVANKVSLNSSSR